MANNSQHCWMLHVASVCTPGPVPCCWMLLRVVGQSLKPVKLFSQQLLTFLLFLDRQSIAQQCWIRLHSSSNIVGAAHAHCAWFTKTCDGLYPSHDALQVPTLLGVLLHPFAHHCQHARKNPSCCVRLHAALGSFSVLQMNLITKWRFPKDWIDIVQYQHHFAALKGNQTSNSFHNTKTHLNWNFYFQLSTVVANTNFI